MPSMNAEYDLVLMSLVTFVPSIAARLALIFVPRGKEEVMRGVALFGTAITLMLSLWMFIDYKAQVSDFYQADSARGTLNARAEAADSGCASAARLQPMAPTARATPTGLAAGPGFRSSKSTTTWASTKPLRGERIDDD